MFLIYYYNLNLYYNINNNNIKYLIQCLFIVINVFIDDICLSNTFIFHVIKFMTLNCLSYSEHEIGILIISTSNGLSEYTYD